MQYHVIIIHYQTIIKSKIVETVKLIFLQSSLQTRRRSITHWLFFFLFWNLSIQFLTLNFPGKKISIYFDIFIFSRFSKKKRNLVSWYGTNVAGGGGGGEKDRKGRKSWNWQSCSAVRSNQYLILSMIKAFKFLWTIHDSCSLKKTSKIGYLQALGVPFAYIPGTLWTTHRVTMWLWMPAEM